MYKNILLLFALCLGTVYSRYVNFRVISFGRKVQVQIVGGKKYDLSLEKGDEILYTRKVNNVPLGVFKYYYIEDGKKEDFVRETGPKTVNTYIEFFGRKDTIKKLKTFSYPDKKWNKSIGETELFDESYIPTIHITGKTAEDLMKKPRYKYFYLEKVTFYLKNNKKVVTNVKTDPKNWGFAKFQMRMEFLSGQNINGRTLLKLRNGGEDPLNLRQLIYGNIIETLGMPSIKSVMVRVYYNKKPAGFYTLQEEAFSESFVKAEFHGDPKTQTIKNEKIGQPFNGECGAEYSYSDSLSHYSQFNGANKTDQKTKLRAFTKALSKFDTKKATAKEIERFEKQWFDIDTFHKAMAMEYLTADWNGYWYTNCNFASYDDPTQSTKTTFKHYYISQDHDETFGVGLTKKYNKMGVDYPKISYKTLLKDKYDHGSKHRTLVDKFIKDSPILQRRFEKTLISIVENIFNPVNFKEVVDTYHERYRPEMKWDFSFERAYKPSKYVSQGIPDYTFKDYEKNLSKRVGGLKWGLYEWIKLKADSVCDEFCISYKGRKPSKKCVKKY
ncbi:hypothetical protein PIROE2DRAFT_9266 [Piromyces sp. E2]|nr:hypothetical protein PIROE2DRAFT_9266 [Piromyces sp. E2]|eukprot:OUM64041.1 hypothetical protein PIROE2DRAFT_9266 [Piromyces sp. E2]